MHEIDFITRLASGLARSPDQVNRIMESDAELIPLDGCDGMILAVTADSVVEEIGAGLYEDPYLIGWMTVIASVSDLAAVGARPVGLLIIQHIPAGTSAKFLQRMQQGIHDAAEVSGTFVLGGDTGQAESVQTVGVAVGVVQDTHPMTRVGMKPGDLVFCSGKAGVGNAFAFSHFMGAEHGLVPYRPLPRLKEGQVVRKYASSCIDTSDGLIPAIATLGHVNAAGVFITADRDDFMHEAALALVDESGLPPWFFYAGPHGDFELLFSVPPDRAVEFLRAAGNIDWDPVRIGTVEARPGLKMDAGNRGPVSADPGAIADLFAECGGDPVRYLDLLQSFHRRLVS